MTLNIHNYFNLQVCNEVFQGSTSDKIRFIPPNLWSEVLYLLGNLLEFHIADGAILHLCWAHRVFNEIAKERYLLPIQELIYKRLAHYFNGSAAKSKTNSLPISNDEMNDSGKNKHTAM